MRLYKGNLNITFSKAKNNPKMNIHPLLYEIRSRATNKKKLIFNF